MDCGLRSTARAGRVILFPSRSPRYPHDSLEAVLRHEVAHILIARAADGQAVPRWFNEGLAMVAERAWHFEDRRQLAWALVSADRVRMDDVNDLFQAGSSGAGRGIRARLVRSCGTSSTLTGRTCPHEDPRRCGERSGVRTRLRAGDRPLACWCRHSFHAELTSWTRRLPLLTSPVVLWMIVTVLAMYAISGQPPTRRRTAQEMVRARSRGRRQPAGGDVARWLDQSRRRLEGRPTLNPFTVNRSR